MTIILASASPRRHELLAKTKLEFVVMSVDVDETRLIGESPIDYIERMVDDKSQAAIMQLQLQLNENHQEVAKPNADFYASFIIITADTIGVLADGHTVLVKPIDKAHAYSMWQQMSDSTHQVWTAVKAVRVQLSLAKNSQKQLIVKAERQIIERTEVSFVKLTATMMSDYWDTGEPKDKAGGYGIQGLAAAWVTRISGSYTNVVGLPLAQTQALIESLKDQLSG